MSLFFPILTTVPDFSDSPEYGYSSTQDVVNVAQSEAYAVFPQTQLERRFLFLFTLTTNIELRAFKEFFRARGGRAHPFYLPSWRNDLPYISGSTGATALRVTATGYPALVADTFEDFYARQLFIWSPYGDALFSTRIISATEPTAGETLMQIETPLTFTPDINSVIGYCHLARFSEDRISWRHRHPTLASAKIAFQSVRAFLDDTSTGDITRIDRGNFLGFTNYTNATS